MTRRTWYVLGMLLAACILLPLLLQVKALVDLDTWLFLEVWGAQGTGLRTFLQLFTELGSLTVWALIIPLLWMIRKREAAVTLLLALLLVVLIGYSMKYAIDRPRPYEVIAHIGPLHRLSDPSFPSGHAMTAFAGAVAVGKKWRKVFPLLLVLAAAIGFSRVYIGVHYPFDVIGGALIGILIGLLVDGLDLSRPIAWIGSRIKTITDRLSSCRSFHRDRCTTRK